MRTMAFVATLALVGMMLAPSAVAVHGSAYTAVGIAYKSTGIHTPAFAWVGPVSVPADTEVYKATVTYHGFWDRSYSVEIRDMDTGEVVTYDKFPGLEQWGCCVQGQHEFFQYHGCHGVGQWGVGTCLEDPDFDVYGLQYINVQTQQTMMLYSGWYQDWALYLVVEEHAEDLIG